MAGPEETIKTMTTIAGATHLNQIAYVVEELDSHIAWWSKVMGVGPWLVLRDLVYDTGDLHGEKADLRLHAAMAYTGDITIELIVPVGPSIFSEFHEAGGKGMHHTCVFTDDFAKTESDVLARGGKRLQGGTIGGGEIGYYDMGGDQGVILEIAGLAEPSKAMFAALREAGRTWDGVDPIWQLPG